MICRVKRWKERDKIPLVKQMIKNHLTKKALILMFHLSNYLQKISYLNIAVPLNIKSNHNRYHQEMQNVKLNI